MFEKLKINFNRFWGAIRSKHPAAYLGIGIRAAAPITHLVDDTLSFFSRRKPKVDMSKIHCIFIVCPPRSGGTLMYQALSRALPSTYISNFHALFPKIASRIIRRFNREFKQIKFANYYGYTSSLFDVNEGNEFFEWAHDTFSGIPNNQIRLTDRNQFRQLIKRLDPQLNECVIFKNVKAYSVVRRIHEAIPEIVFVRVRRERSQVIESVVSAYYELGYFHPIPDIIKNIEITDPIEFSCAQIDAIEASLNEQFSDIKSNSKFEIQYEDFCRKPYHAISKLAYEILNLPPGTINESPSLNYLNPSKRKKVSEADRKKIRSILDQKTMTK